MRGRNRAGGIGPLPASDGQDTDEKEDRDRVPVVLEDQPAVDAGCVSHDHGQGKRLVQGSGQPGEQDDDDDRPDQDEAAKQGGAAQMAAPEDRLDRSKLPAR
jgi:hypothetical protein